MMHSRLSRLFTLVAVPALIVTFSTPALSQEERHGYAKEGGYVGVTGLLGFTFDGETFDGETAYIEVDGDEMMILPGWRRRI